MDPFAAVGGAAVTGCRTLSRMQCALGLAGFAIKLLVPLWDILSIVVERQLVTILDPAVRPEAQSHQMLISAITTTLQHVDRQVGVARVVDEMCFVSKLASIDRVGGLLLRVVVKVKEICRSGTVLHLGSTLRLFVRDDLAHITRDEGSWRHRFPLIQNQTPSFTLETLDLQRKLPWPLRVVPGATRTTSALGVALPQEFVRLCCDFAVTLEGKCAAVIDDFCLFHTTTVVVKSTLSRCT